MRIHIVALLCLGLNLPYTDNHHHHHSPLIILVILFIVIMAEVGWEQIWEVEEPSPPAQRPSTAPRSAYTEL